MLKSTLQTRGTKSASSLKTLQESEQQRQSYSQKHSLALEPDSATLNAIFLFVFIQAGEYSARPTTSTGDEYRCSIHCEPFYWQLVHVGDIFQARDVLFIKNLMSFKQLWLTVIYGRCVYPHQLNLTIVNQPARRVRVYSCGQKRLLSKRVSKQ